jgi:hypothetical protein
MRARDTHEPRQQHSLSAASACGGGEDARYKNVAA